MAARKAEEKRRGHRAAVPPARPMRRHRPREGGKRSIGRERLPDSHVPPSPIPWKRARNQPGMYFVGNGRKIAHVANGVIRTGKNDSGSSPRAWGCFSFCIKFEVSPPVFPTCVGVFRSHGPFHVPGSSLPHVRGGVSCGGRSRSRRCGSSPRAWGCFSDNAAFPPCGWVFPTCVGVFLHCRSSLWSPSRLPHARGGVSYSDKVGKEVYGSSPRTRGRAWMNALFSLAFPTRMGCFGFIRTGRSAFC